MKRFLDSTRWFHEALTAEQFDVTTNQQLDDVQNAGIAGDLHEHGIILSATIDLPHRRRIHDVLLTPDGSFL